MNISNIKLQKLLSQIVSLLPLRERKKLRDAPHVTCVFVGQAYGRRLNREFRGLDYATDVLSFAPIEANYLGELVFCEPVLKRQAREHKISEAEEFQYLLIHGLLHLLGYDHEKSDKEASRMYRLQDSIFDQLAPEVAVKKTPGQGHGTRNRTVRRKK